jgi:flagellar biosynthetic protein FliQ
MTYDFVMGVSRQALETMLSMSLPILLSAMVVGLAVSVFQSATQIQEMTLTFVPKIIATMLALLLFGPWILAKMTDFATEVFQNIPYWIR